MLKDTKLELIRIGKKLKDMLLYDIYYSTDIFEFYKIKFQNDQKNKEIILHTINKKL